MDLAPIEAEHDRIAADFAAMQEALVHAVHDPTAAARARQHGQAFAARLRAHIRFEDEQLLPLFEARVSPPPTGCSVDLLLAEHRKLERLLDECEAQLDTHLAGSSQDAAALLRLIEAQRGLREVLDHHDQRERAAFFPALAAVLDEEERASLLERSAQAHPTTHLRRP